MGRKTNWEAQDRGTNVDALKVAYNNARAEVARLTRERDEALLCLREIYRAWLHGGGVKVDVLVRAMTALGIGDDPCPP